MRPRVASPLQLTSLAAGVCAAGVFAPAGSPAAGQDADLRAIEAEVEQSRKDWSIPGLGLAVVQGDSILLARGFGVGSVEGGEPVDGATLFAVGSTTKAFTATAIAMLVDEAALGWDDPVVDHLPEFRLADPWVTRAITLRDLLAHRSGLPMANLMWLPGHLDGDEMIRRLRHLEPTAGFREAMTYQNVLYLVAGRVLAARSGRSWSDFLATRIFEPLGMTRSRTGLTGLTEASNVATPHARVDGAVTTIPYRDIAAVGPAGSVLSSAEDMARWLLFQLARGTVGDERIVGEQTLLETRRPQILMRPEGPLSLFYPEATSLAYAMGWVVSEYRGHTMLDHGGGIDGMTALVALLPERELGVAILANRQLATPPYAILYPVLDRLLGEKPVDRTAKFRGIADAGAAAAAAEPDRVEDASPSLEPEAYEGRYESDPLGTALVRREKDALVFEMGRLVAPLEAWHYDVFRAPWRDRAWRAAAGAGWVTFHLDRKGRVEALDLVPLPGESWRFDRVTGANAPPPDP